ncbi:hypothetical protein EI94DRAFT_1209256 [Lactarius quietus]|nr:hypothetical protein EI94DRAFT_1209256 [Lactarius quietus]
MAGTLHRNEETDFASYLQCKLVITAQVMKPSYPCSDNHTAIQNPIATTHRHPKLTQPPQSYPRFRANANSRYTLECSCGIQHASAGCVGKRGERDRPRRGVQKVNVEELFRHEIGRQASTPLPNANRTRNQHTRPPHRQCPALSRSLTDARGFASQKVIIRHCASRQNPNDPSSIALSSRHQAHRLHGAVALEDGTSCMDSDYGCISLWRFPRLLPRPPTPTSKCCLLRAPVAYPHCEFFAVESTRDRTQDPMRGNLDAQFLLSRALATLNLVFAGQDALDVYGTSLISTAFQPFISSSFWCTFCNGVPAVQYFSFQFSIFNFHKCILRETSTLDRLFAVTCVISTTRMSGRKGS